MNKIDLKKEMKDLYNPSAKEVVAVEIPAMNFLLIDGEGSPVAPQYREAIEALFGVSYSLKFMIKKGQGIDYAVMPLEGLWWMDDMTKFSADHKDEWKWTAMIMQPPQITAENVKTAVEQVKKKKKLPALPKLRFESFAEGLAAQILYIGPFSEEGPTIQKIHDYIKNSGYTLSGKHHEIYLNDPSRTAPNKLKTILRQPMKKNNPSFSV
ncbi:MAG: GyrI-like domain-containing protein [Candidatus Bathyarchaeota archaeon]|nr:GyrI-like domain-containing protein [Candidatus Bathyarchaeota archaeon]